jgi:hypothetical protein
MFACRNEDDSIVPAWIRPPIRVVEEIAVGDEVAWNTKASITRINLSGEVTEFHAGGIPAKVLGYGSKKDTVDIAPAAKSTLRKYAIPLSTLTKDINHRLYTSPADETSHRYSVMGIPMSSVFGSDTARFHKATRMDVCKDDPADDGPIQLIEICSIYAGDVLTLRKKRENTHGFEVSVVTVAGFIAPNVAYTPFIECMSAANWPSPPSNAWNVSSEFSLPCYA